MALWHCFWFKQVCWKYPFILCAGEGGSFEQTQGSTQFSASWTVNPETQSVDVTLSTNNPNGWAGFGISDTPSMVRCYISLFQFFCNILCSLWSVKACPAILDRWCWVLALPLVVAPPNLQNQLTLSSESALNYHGFDRSLQNASVGGEGLEKYNPGKSVCKRD